MRKLAVAILACWITGAATGQTGFDNLRNIIPPSPNASSMAKYGSWPVSLYTGVPSISIPVYELKGRSLSVPITLSYHSAGNKVGDVASWVGLGWNLSAGGVITRSVKGLPDDYGYFTSASIFSNPNDMSSAASTPGNLSTLIVASTKSLSDTQEDLYSFSALGKSYKLLLKADGTVQTMPYSNVKVTANPIVGNSAAASSNSWTVLLEDGTKLVFGGGTNYIENTDNVRFKAADGSGGLVYTSSWYLKSITSANGEVFNFTYTLASGTIEQDSYISQSDYMEYRTATNAGGLTECPLLTNGTTNSSTELQTVSALNLSSIESDLGRVDFIINPTERLDLKGGYSLSEIKVYSKLAGKYVEDYQFKTSYATAVSGNALLTGTLNTSYFGYRLHLDSLYRIDMSNISAPVQKWYFDYNAQHLPSRRSYAQDYWGFFNGATSNTTLLPYYYYALDSMFINTGSTANDITGFMPSSHEIGANRTTNPNYIQAEILTGIHYPTGGTSKFTYEPNGLPVNQEQFTKASSSLYLNLNNGAGSHSYNSQTTTITLTKPQYVSINFSNTIGAGILADQPGAKVSVTVTDANGRVMISYSSVNTAVNQWFNLRKTGTYTFKLSVNVDTSSFTTASTYVTASATLGYIQSLGTQSYTQYVGGLRIKSIVDNDGNSTTNVNARYFQYDSAYVINPLDTVNNFVTQITRSTHNSSTGEDCYFTKVVRNTSTTFSQGSIEGGTVGYGQVTTFYGAGGVNGKTVSRFNSEPDAQLITATQFPYPASDSRDWRRGILLEQKDYNAAGSLLKKVNHTYSFTPVGSIIGFKAGYNNYPYFCADAYQNCGIVRMYCYTTSEQVNHLSSTETTYSTATSDSLAITTNFYYDDALNTQPVRTVTINSKGDTILNYNRTALEKSAISSSFTLSSGASTAIDTLVARNIVGTPIESEKYVKGTLTNKAVVNYKVGASSLVLPDNVVVQNSSYSPETRVQFNKYDTYGNLLEQQKASDLKRNYIWDYKSTFPIAEVVNADSANIAHTSFEADGTGNWTIGSSARDNTKGITGGSSYAISNGAISKSGLTSARTYVISYWTTNTTYYTSITGNKSGYPIQGKTIVVNGTSWTYFEHKVTGITSVSISGSGNIDELRLYPDTAQMTTYTYTPLTGMSSQCDLNNRITYFEYDGFNRLYIVRDQDRNVIKKYCYNYSGQSIACQQFTNVVKSGPFTRNNCGAGYTGSTVTYTVPANTYTSLISQAVADSLAQNDVNLNGQNYANANGTCTSSGYTITSTNYVGLTGFTATFTNTSTSVQTVFNIPAAGGTLGSLPGGTYTVVLAKTGNTSTKYIYTVCTTTKAAAVTATFSSMVIGSSCNTLTVDGQ
jgi:hypothetical protein